jgi:thiol:disulfide interchange protein DsbG
MKTKLNKKLKLITTAVTLAIACTFGTSNSSLADTAKKTTPAKTAVKKTAKTKFNPKAVALINKITHNQVAIESSFPAIKDMDGYVVTPKQGPKQRMIIIVQKDGEFAFFGNLITADGKNLSQEYNQKYIVSKQAIDAYKSINTLSYVTQGSDKAAHKAYVLIDPNCIFCHQLYLDMAPLIKAKKLQIRWVPVGIMRPDSSGKAAHLLSAKNNAEAVKLLQEDEDNFKTKTEEGGLSALDTNSTDPTTANAFKKVANNNAFFSNNGFTGTPVILYLDKKDKAAIYPGYPRGAELQLLTDKMSNKF